MVLRQFGERVCVPQGPAGADASALFTPCLGILGGREARTFLKHRLELLVLLGAILLKGAMRGSPLWTLE